MQLLRRQKRKSGREIEPHLIAENRAGAGTGAIAAIGTLVEHMLKKVEISTHDLSLADSANEALKLVRDPQ
jgi:hypothetical protein